jgi:hypothetical protein
MYKIIYMKNLILILFLALIITGNICPQTAIEISDSSGDANFIVSFGVIKNFGDRYSINEENPYRFNLGFHLLNFFTPHFGLMTGVDINKSDGNGTFLHFSGVPQYIINSSKTKLLFGLGGVFGMILKK